MTLKLDKFVEEIKKLFNTQPRMTSCYTSVLDGDVISYVILDELQFYDGKYLVTLEVDDLLDAKGQIDARLPSVRECLVPEVISGDRILSKKEVKELVASLYLQADNDVATWVAGTPSPEDNFGFGNPVIKL